ncbi:MAG: hypothetical protein JWO33_1719, partial [Caulobacteraceae bacterium]|nr:hypothetical protein [Caulobacteraceae bacterium]
MKTLALIAGAASAATLLAMSTALAQQNAPATPANIVSIFDERCKFCHDPAVDRAPSREALRQRSPESIVEALTRGVMQPMAAGLSAEEIRGLAVYLSGRPLAPAAPAAGAATPGGG